MIVDHGPELRFALVAGWDLNLRPLGCQGRYRRELEQESR